MPAALAACFAASAIVLVAQVRAIGRVIQPLTLPLSQVAWNEFSRMKPLAWLNTTSCA
jgi:hypothetical protein